MKVISYTLVGEDIATKIFFESILKEIGKKQSLHFKRTLLWDFPINKNSNKQKVVAGISTMSSNSLIVKNADLFLFGVDADTNLEKEIFDSELKRIQAFVPPNIQSTYQEKLVAFCPVLAIEYWIYAVSRNLQSQAQLAINANNPLEFYGKAKMKEICYGKKAPNRDETEYKLKDALKEVDFETAVEMSFSFRHLYTMLNAFCTHTAVT